MGVGRRSGKGDKTMMGSYIASKEETEAKIWCIKNNIKISPWAKDISNWYVSVIINNGKNNVSPEAYPRVEIWVKVYEFYKYYYKKYYEDKI